jgi:hypothetical protein
MQPAALRKIMAQHDYMRLMTYDPTSDQVTCQFLDRVGNEALSSGIPQKTAFDTSGPELDNIVFGLGRWLPGWLGRAYNRFVRRHAFPLQPPRVGVSHLMFQADIDYPSHDMSYGIPLDRLRPAIERIREEFKRIKYEPNIPFGIRFLAATDKSALAPNSGRDTAMVEFASAVPYDKSPAKRELLMKAQAAFEGIMVHEFAGRPHWQKEHHLNPEQAYPSKDWQEFRALSNRLGGEKFLNEWSRRGTPMRESSGRELRRTAMPVHPLERSARL